MTAQGITGHVEFSNHFLVQMINKEFTVEQVESALRNPVKVTDVKKFPGQKRYCGSGVAIVVSKNVAITIYKDGVVTPLRADQKNDASALNSVRINGSK